MLVDRQIKKRDTACGRNNFMIGGTGYEAKVIHFMQTFKRLNPNSKDLPEWHLKTSAQIK